MRELLSASFYHPSLSITARHPRLGRKTPASSHDFDPREDASKHLLSRRCSILSWAKSSFCGFNTPFHLCVLRSSCHPSDLLPSLLLSYRYTHNGWPNHPSDSPIW